MTEAPIIARARGLTKRYGRKTVLNDVDFDIYSEEFLKYRSARRPS